MKKLQVVFILLFALGCATLIPLKVSETPDLTIERTDERIEKGEYLATNLMLCTHCHSKIDKSFFGGKIEPASLGAGGEEWNEWFGIVYGANITPFALRDWTDGEIAQAITEGVHKDGSALFPIMPYGSYRTMAEEDLYSVIAFIRTLKPVSGAGYTKKLKFPFKYIERTLPRPYEPKVKPSINNAVEYGRYLGEMGDCIRCHTPFDKKGVSNMELLLAGGNEMQVSESVKIITPNISPDDEFGIGSWSKEDFIDRFKEYEEFELSEPENNTVMPWSYFAGLSEEDLSAIFDFIQSVPPINVDPEAPEK